MSRSFSTSSLVKLPRVSAISAARLLQELLNAANAEKKLPASIADDRDELLTARNILQTALQKRLTGEGEEPPAVRAADLVEDNAFGALFDWLTAWTRLPAEQHPESTEAETVLHAVFPTGLTFLAVRPSDEWQEAELRLRLMAEKGYEKTIVKLGGKSFLDEIKAAHKVYGEVLGITAVKSVQDTPALREARDGALDVVRAYVLGVSAHARKKDAPSAELAERLLAPLSQWKDRRGRGGAAVSEPTADEATAPDAGSSPTG
jgi:hypothetical protein